MRRSIVIAVGWPYPGWAALLLRRNPSPAKIARFGQLDPGLKRDARQNQRLDQSDHSPGVTPAAHRIDRELTRIQPVGPGHEEKCGQRVARPWTGPLPNG